MDEATPKRKLRDLEDWKSLDVVLRQYLRSKLPNFSDRHNDLINEVYIGLLSGIEKGLIGGSEDISSFIRSEACKRIAITILKRRVADFYRKDVYRWANRIDTKLELDDFATEQAGPSRTLQMKSLLVCCMQILASYPDADRQALTDHVLSISEMPADDATRKRISRLRQKLREDIERTLGTSIEKLLE